MIEKIFIEAYKKTIGSEYLFICDDELFAREIYEKEITFKYEKIAEEFRANVKENIDEAIKKNNIKLVDYSYEAITKDGEIFVRELNKKIVEMTSKQSKLKSTVIVDLELDTELSIGDRNNYKKIFEIVIKKGSLDREKQIEKLKSKLYELLEKNNIKKEEKDINIFINSVKE